MAQEVDQGSTYQMISAIHNIHWSATPCGSTRCPAVSSGRAFDQQRGFGQMVCVSGHSRECQDPEFPCRTLCCDETASLIHFNCQEFECQKKISIFKGFRSDKKSRFEPLMIETAVPHRLLFLPWVQSTVGHVPHY